MVQWVHCASKQTGMPSGQQRQGVAQCCCEAASLPALNRGMQRRALGAALPSARAWLPGRAGKWQAIA